MGIKTIVDRGFDGLVAEIECQISQGLPNVTIVGYASKTVDEARERIRSAFQSLPIDWPRKRIVINLAPADIPKENTSFDLPIAIAILESINAVRSVDSNMVFFGELGLDGDLRPVRGLIGKLMAARKHHFKTAIIPSMNLDQAKLLNDLDIVPCRNLLDAYEFLNKGISPDANKAAIETHREPREDLDIANISGQAQAKRALAIAAAGRHNILLEGPPGTGKSMLAKALVSILPAMSKSEILETTHIHSLYSNRYESIITSRPFRSPHHSASDSAIIGGGSRLRPGEISLAHNGVLFFDELPEFRRNAIEALRQPLEEASINIHRANDSLQLPARFMFVATANPCPCGYYGTDQSCSCSPASLDRYRRKLSGPILDRIDIHTEVNNVKHSRLLNPDSDMNSAQIRQQIDKAISRQYQRLGNGRFNGDLVSSNIGPITLLQPAAKSLLDKAASQLALSPRAYIKTIKVARTIADLEASEAINPNHIAEALQYRPSNRFQ